MDIITLIPSVCFKPTETTELLKATAWATDQRFFDDLRNFLTLRSNSETTCSSSQLLASWFHSQSSSFATQTSFQSWPPRKKSSTSPTRRQKTLQEFWSKCAKKNIESKRSRSWKECRQDEKWQFSSQIWWFRLSAAGCHSTFGTLCDCPATICPNIIFARRSETWLFGRYKNHIDILINLLSVLRIQTRCLIHFCTRFWATASATSL